MTKTIRDRLQVKKRVHRKKNTMFKQSIRVDLGNSDHVLHEGKPQAQPPKNPRPDTCFFQNWNTGATRRETDSERESARE